MFFETFNNIESSITVFFLSLIAGILIVLIVNVGIYIYSRRRWVFKHLYFIIYQFVKKLFNVKKEIYIEVSNHIYRYLENGFKHIEFDDYKGDKITYYFFKFRTLKFYQNTKITILDLYNIFVAGTIVLSLEKINFNRKRMEFLFWYATTDFMDRINYALEINEFQYNYFDIKPFNFNKHKLFFSRYKFWRKYVIKTKTFYYADNLFTQHFSVNTELFFTLKLKTFSYITIENRTLIFNIIFKFYNFLKSIILSLIITLIFFIILLNYFNLNIIRQLAIWFVVGILFFWLISGFNFFLKRYKFGKLTSVVLRFWKRTNTYFWLVEGFLFSIFFYYYLNSSQETVYSLDFASLSQTYLPNLSLFYFNIILLILLIILLYIWLLNLQSFLFSQNLFFMFIGTLTLLYFYLIESYQFFYTITVFFENIWQFNYDHSVWYLDIESPKLRVKHQYSILIMLAKYWHFIFIFIMWLFFVLKNFEQSRALYTFTGVSIQNLIFLFWLNFLFTSQWFKWTFKRFLESSYYWFYSDTNSIVFNNFFSELLYLIKDNKSKSIS